MESTNQAMRCLLSGEEAEKFKALLSLPIDQFIRDCRIQSLQLPGPGGSHKNRTYTAVRIQHPEWKDWVAVAGEQREGEKNRRLAAQRLRLKAALEQRCAVVLPLPPFPWEKPKVSLTHPLYPLLISFALDLLYSANGSLALAAKELKWSSSALLRQLYADKQVWATAQRIVQAAGAAPLHPPRSS
jgi:hypothetical protein